MEHIRREADQGHSGGLSYSSTDIEQRLDEVESFVRGFRETPEAYYLLQLRLRVRDPSVVDEYIRESLGGVERSQARASSDREELGVPGPVCRWCGGLELHRDGCNVLLFTSIFLQELRAGPREDRQDQHPLSGFVVLHP